MANPATDRRVSAKETFMSLRSERFTLVVIGLFSPLFLHAGIAPSFGPPPTTTFTVNSTADAIDANVGDGVCATVTQTCTLRAAIMEGNAVAATNVVLVNVPAGTYTLTIPGRNETQSATGSLDITRAMTINGAGSGNTIVQASLTDASTGIDRIFVTFGQGSFNTSISGMTLRFANPGPSQSGAIMVQRPLSLDDVVIRDCVASSGAGVTVLGTTLSMHNCSIVNNVGYGAIVGSLACNITILDSSIRGNTSPNDSFGVTIDSNSTLTMSNSTVSGNVGPVYCAGVMIGGNGATDATSATLTNCTISGNDPVAGFGVLVYPGASASLKNTTVAMNAVGISSTGTTTLSNTLLANRVTNCNLPLTSSGHNLSTDNSCASSFMAAGDLNNAVAKLAPLMLNSPGITSTHALLPGSAAIDAGGGCVSEDQRFLDRPFGIACDIGAYEFENVGTVKSDFNNDGRSDIVLQSSSGAVAAWLMDTNNILQGKLVASPVAGWQTMATGDNNADYRADILLKNNNTGAIAEWQMFGTTLSAGAVINTPNLGWQVVSSRDFDHDGKADVVLQNTTTGAVALWLVNGFSVTAGSIIGTPPVTRQLVGTGNLGGDAMVFQDTVSGTVSRWILQNGAVISDQTISTPNIAWHVTGVGDFDGDGNDDLVLQNSTTGAIAVWLLGANGTTLTSGTVVGSPAAGWKVAGTGDYNGDGKSDLLLYNSQTGEIAEWLLNGAALAAGWNLGTVPGWKPLAN